MTRFEEGSLAFEFGDDQWQVVHYDVQDSAYRKRLEVVDGTKAVDFIGVFDEEELYLIEVKDFRGHRVENKARLETGELALELAQKVRDSIAGIIGLQRANTSDNEIWKGVANLLCRHKRPIKVILWLEHDMPSHPKLRKKARASIQVNKFKQKLRWLTSKVLIVNLQTQNVLPDITVYNLPLQSSSTPPQK